MSALDNLFSGSAPFVSIARPFWPAFHGITSVAAQAPGPDVFADYDVVVAIPRRVINQQLHSLHASGAIVRRLVLVQHVDANGNFTYEALASSDQIPRGPNGTPTLACIDAEVCPRIDIPASGTLVTLVLQFLNGSVWTGGGFGPLAGVQQHDATGWSYGVDVTLDLAAVAKGDMAKVPPAVQQQLNGFLDADFRVDHLFLDLDSANLLTFDPATTNTGTAGDDGAKQFTLFMQSYLSKLGSGNPFVLGYAVTATDQTQVPANQNVPDSLRPTGTTFTLYHDPADPDLSTVNYVLATRGGHGTIRGTPANFTANWIAPGDTCDAKVVYSHSCLAEPLLVAPLFKQVREGVYAQISQHVSVGEGNDYAAARQPTANGWTFSISQNTGSGDDRYGNTFSVACGGAQLSFSGEAGAYKEVSQNNFFCTARAYAWGDAKWGGTITLGTAGGALTATGNFGPPQVSSDSETNSCADAFSWMGRIVGGLLDLFTGWTDGGFFSNLFASEFSVNIPGIGNLNVVLGNLSASATSVVVLPAGGVFDFAAPAIDAAGNVSLELTYRP